MTIRRSASVLAALLLTACTTDPRPPSEPAPQTPSSAKPSAMVGSAAQAMARAQVVEHVPVAEPTPEELPVPEDFENEAASEITTANYRAQLDAIEQELNVEPN